MGHFDQAGHTGQDITGDGLGQVLSGSSARKMAAMTPA
jgi:hypothetical protein